ncbi:MAG TPA: hypothetical protein PK916_05030 [Bacteroidota bacterium]|nr:hypothetical protein [Bacteroidota bacterium]
MERYKNLGGDSGVSGYTIGAGSITVYFMDGAVYLYTNASAGSARIRQMIQLATAGEGLNSFINREVRNNYAKRIR